MSLATGGRAVGATSTRSRSASAASRNASSMRTMPTCSPLGPTSRTSGTRIRSLMRGSVLMWPPRDEIVVALLTVRKRLPYRHRVTEAASHLFRCGHTTGAPLGRPPTGPDDLGRSMRVGGLAPLGEPERTRRPGGSLCRIPGCGHHPHATHPPPASARAPAAALVRTLRTRRRPPHTPRRACAEQDRVLVWMSPYRAMLPLKSIKPSITAVQTVSSPDIAQTLIDLAGASSDRSLERCANSVRSSSRIVPNIRKVPSDDLEPKIVKPIPATVPQRTEQRERPARARAGARCGHLPGGSRCSTPRAAAHPLAGVQALADLPRRVTGRPGVRDGEGIAKERTGHAVQRRAKLAKIA